MSFEPASPITIITCDQCQGKGCSSCDQQGIYALQDNQPVIFNLPDFIDLKARRHFKQIFWIKRITLLISALIIIIIIWKILF